MDLRIVAVALVITLAFVGAVYAMPGLRAGLGGWPGEGMNASMHNGTWHGRGPMQNGSMRPGPGMFVRGGRGVNGSFTPPCNATPRANTTEMEQFRQALTNGDYQTAKQMHEAYGLGGPIFDRLNETTFADYSQIAQLTGKLAQELGLGNRSVPGMGDAGASFRGGMQPPHCGKPQVTSQG